MSGRPDHRGRRQVFDLPEKQVTGLNDRRKLRLLFTNLESRVADRLLPFLDVEFRALPEHERAAAVDAARETFDRAALTDDDLFATDLDTAFLYRFLVRTVPGLPRCRPVGTGSAVGPAKGLRRWPGVPQRPVDSGL
ncbi:hypothetical protein OHS18_28880 [Amycolatopsis sp. NBC_00355]|uniref:NACHT N-terminal Helical domain 1-containing protein n=1 Tax=Amycolatopsis sp. NBC_00355 TaxID=2975957 RepID=UPI002E272927